MQTRPRLEHRDLQLLGLGEPALAAVREREVGGGVERVRVLDWRSRCGNKPRLGQGQTSSKAYGYS